MHCESMASHRNLWWNSTICMCLTCDLTQTWALTQRAKRRAGETAKRESAWDLKRERERESQTRELERELASEETECCGLSPIIIDICNKCCTWRHVALIDVWYICITKCDLSQQSSYGWTLLWSLLTHCCLWCLTHNCAVKLLVKWLPIDHTDLSLDPCALKVTRSYGSLSYNEW